MSFELKEYLVVLRSSNFTTELTENTEEYKEFLSVLGELGGKIVLVYIDPLLYLQNPAATKKEFIFPANTDTGQIWIHFTG